MNKTSIIILSTQGSSLPIAYNFLKQFVDIEQVIVEKTYSKKKMIKYRVKNLGVLTVAGQLLFILFSKFLQYQSRHRRKAIINSHNLSHHPIPEESVRHVPSVNSKQCRSILRQSKADFILVNGTRIISKKTLKSTKKKFVNIHAGITPKYRGVHGGYWSLAEQDEENFGATLHYIDSGVDTGDIIAQSVIQPTKEDTFATYPLLQQIEGLHLLVDSIEFITAGNSGYTRSDLPSKQWFHPTLFGYLRRRLKLGIK